MTLTVAGSNFVSGSQVMWNGSLRSTTFVSASGLTAQVTAADLATIGTASVTVQNSPTSSSSAMPFTISALPGPTVASLAPQSALAGSGALTVTVTGANFVPGSVVNWNGSARTTTVVSATQLTAQITAADLASSGTAAVVVQNPGSASVAATFTINNPVPAAIGLAPSTAALGSAALTVTVSGTNFVSTSVVSWSGAARSTTFVSSTQLTALITAADLGVVGTANLSVANPAPGGGSSNTLAFTVTNPLPVLASLSPATAMVGANGVLLGANGTGFVASSQVLWNGSARTTTFVSSTQLTAAIPASDLAAAGTATVTVSTAAPGGGTSAGLSFAIGNPLPVLAAITPTNVVAGGSAFTLVLSGSSFMAGSTVMLNGSARTTIFTSGNSLSATVTAADIATAGSASITVVTPGPGGGTSGTQTLTIQQTANPTPVLSSFSPNTVNAGSAAFTITVTGSGFVQGSTVLWNGSARATTFGSATSLTVQITAADIATAGTANVSVSSPTPGGGASGTLPFVIAVPPNPVPTITTISPISAGANSGAFTLAVNGTGFASTSQVLWNGAARVTTYVSATQVKAAILASDITTQGTASVTVTSPTPGGGTSNAATFTIGPQVNPVPTITSLTPGSVTVATNPVALTIAIVGTGFMPTSSVLINGYFSYGSVLYLSSSLLQATIPSGNLSTVGTLQISVANTAPGGGTSTQVPFSVTAPANSKFTLQALNVTANDIVWDSIHQMLYASTPSTGMPTGNSIVPISPTGQSGTAVYAGSEPSNLAISSDASMLYTELTGSDKIQRFTLPEITMDLGFSLGLNSNSSPYVPVDLGVAPGQPHTVAVLRNYTNYSYGSLVIYDDAAPRAKVSDSNYYYYNAGGKNAIVWGNDAHHLYANSSVGYSYLTSFTVDATGIAASTNYQSSNYNNASGIRFDPGTGYIYDNSGHVTDPATGLPIGVFSASGAMTTDSALGVAYFLGVTSNYPGNTYTLAAYDLKHFTPIATTTLYGVVGTPTRLIRFGADGLAFVTAASTYPTSAGRVYLLNGSFVTSPSTIANPFEGGVAMPQNLWTVPLPLGAGPAEK